MSIPIALSRVHFPVTTLGPGRRLGIWFQGCSIRCPGCISSDTWARRPGDRGVGEVIAELCDWIAEADGITVSGGEPFEQPEALEALLRQIRARTPADILVYTGFGREVVECKLGPLQGLIDALISGPFEIEATQTHALWGSDNQRLWYLTELGRKRFEHYDRPAADEARSLDIGIDENGEVWLAGIPKRGDLARLAELLRSAGHEIKTSEDRSWRRTQ